MGNHRPKILAPAGDINAFLAAIAAGADAVYCGLKMFSARMEARNFSMDELSRLSVLSRNHNVDLYVALNTIIKEHELDRTAGIIAKLVKYVRPHALIVQDPGLAALSRQCGFNGELHLSTLGNCTFPLALDAARKAGFSRVVLPRELSIDEVKLMAQAAPEDLDLEMFIHGALCYAVSGRCYWSSWFGGRSGLRGRCVQPCRRVYTQETPFSNALPNSGRENLPQNASIGPSKKKFSQRGDAPPREKSLRQNQMPPQTIKEGRYFSCLDFSADVLVKVLKEIPKVTTWKIEGRKKSPHYVFYTVKAYKMLRDLGHDPEKKKTALSFLDYAMGRPSTHYNLLSQRPQSPLKMDSETGSGLFIGRVKMGDAPHVIPREALMTDDLLRIGYEDDPWHTVYRVTRSVPKKGRLVLTGKENFRKKGTSGKPRFKKGAPVFIVDRREKAVWELIANLEVELEKYRSPEIEPQEIDWRSHGGNPRETVDAIPLGDGSKRRSVKQSGRQLILHGFGNESNIKAGTDGRGGGQGRINGLWLSASSVKRCDPSKYKSIWWFMPPVLWPEDQKGLISLISELRAAGSRNFVLNMPWQISCFQELEKNAMVNLGSDRTLNLWAGPFCNVTNTVQIEYLKTIGFSGAFVSPELDREDFFRLPNKSLLPLGIVLAGHWPLAISRTVSEEIELNQLFHSKKKESAWVSKKGGDYWVFPNWIVDLTLHRPVLEESGYRLFLEIDETLPKGISLKKRPGLWNWDLKLL